VEICTIPLYPNYLDLINKKESHQSSSLQLQLYTYYLPPPARASASLFVAGGLIPGLGTKSAVCNGRLCNCEAVANGVDDVVSPPVGLLLVGQLQGEEYDDQANEQTRVQCGRENVVIARPPSKVSVFDVLVKDVSNDSPRTIVKGGSWRNETSSSEDNRCNEVTSATAREEAGGGVDDGGDESTEEEEPHGCVVDWAVGTKDTSRTDETPQD